MVSSSFAAAEDVTAACSAGSSSSMFSSVCIGLPASFASTWIVIFTGMLTSAGEGESEEPLPVAASSSQSVPKLRFEDSSPRFARSPVQPYSAALHGCAVRGGILREVLLMMERQLASSIVKSPMNQCLPATKQVMSIRRTAAKHAAGRSPRPARQASERIANT